VTTATTSTAGALVGAGIGVGDGVGSEPIRYDERQRSGDDRRKAATTRSNAAPESVA
jgi:hypothetical protein